MREAADQAEEILDGTLAGIKPGVEAARGPSSESDCTSPEASSMTFFGRSRVASALVLAMGMAITACGAEADQIPGTVCGTRVSPELTRSVLTSTEELVESSRVDRQEEISAPCTWYSQGRPVLELHFYWSMDAPKLAERSPYDSIFADVAEWRTMELGEEAIVGTNGSIVSAPCESGRSKQFTLELHLPEAKITDEGRRKDIEKFMRAYFPATVKTLSCG
ncbi:MULTISPECIES: hypothetical protein [unclassified Streptomyces]|uniref:hypothetical protein n=1 Tax=unclassified Streptomyces TaxID=2593676 RepID=UPI00093934B3|nr:hypothetical protein [Streptomyces sp. TSRI0107]OKJ87948.1 hypothetical protein AMK31_12525 [Streptomyces sp. TSRI0107]